MKLLIGEKIKELRHQKDITQDQLAVILDVSNQSISRWELGICYPDIELLPAIANYFDITLDDLVGMNQVRSEAMRNEIFTSALNYEQQNNWIEAIKILRKALGTYPNDDGFRSELALALSRTNDEADQIEAITISEKVLEHCTNEKIRSTVRANLCFLYKAAGLYEKAVEMGRTLPHIWECREMLLPDLVPEEHRAEMVARSFNIASQVLRDVASGSGISFSLGYAPKADVNGEALIQNV